jgi:predicted lipoprotein with Yx(FWY)xxD motif
MGWSEEKSTIWGEKHVQNYDGPYNSAPMGGKGGSRRHPLYFWFKDTKPGDVTGDGLEGFHDAR